MVVGRLFRWARGFRVDIRNLMTAQLVSLLIHVTAE
jgi:hypothetical protein